MMNEFQTRRQRRGIGGRMPWAHLALGLALLVEGVVLMTNARAPFIVVAWFAAIGLITAGLAQRVQRKPPPWLDFFPSLALMALAAAIAWLDVDFAILSQLLALAALGRALFAIVQTAQGALRERCAATFSAAAAVLFGGVVLAQPALAPPTFFFLFAAWLVVAGVLDLLQVLAARFRRTSLQRANRN
jgi:uncharacterized membrane protein HdeD (DUF308 family)